MVCWGPGLVGHSVPESTGPIITPSPPLLLSIIGTTLPTLQELYSSRVRKGAVKITLNPSHQHTPSLNCYRLVDATEL